MEGFENGNNNTKKRAGHEAISKRSIRRILCSAITAALIGSASATTATSSFVTFESGQVRPLAMTPDGRHLLSVNTPDNRLEVFRILKDGLEHDKRLLKVVAYLNTGDGNYWAHPIENLVAVVDLDHSSDSRLLLRMLDASPGVRIASQPVDLEDARSQLRRLDVFAIVLVPRDVTRQALRGRQGTVFAYYNATYMTTGQSAARDIGDAVSAWNARLLRERIGLQVGPGKLRAAPIAVQSDILYNPARSQAR